MTNSDSFLNVAPILIQFQLISLNETFALRVYDDFMLHNPIWVMQGLYDLGIGIGCVVLVSNGWLLGWVTWLESCLMGLME